MRTAGLQAIHTIISSQAVLITSSTPHHTVTPALAPMIPLIVSRLAGIIAAKESVYVSYNIKRDSLVAA